MRDSNEMSEAERNSAFLDSAPSEPALNRRKYRHIASCFLPQMPFALLAVGLVYRGYWLLLPAFFLLIVVPVLDTLTGWQDNGHFHKGDFSSVDTFLFRWNTRLYAIFYLIAFVLGQLALLLALYLFSGPTGLLFYLGQVAGAHIVLESVNYIQHYGLLRERHDGQYEKTGAEHSWDTYHYFSSYSTFRVGHH